MFVPVVCILMMLLGCHGAYDMFRDLASSHININLQFLFLPLGVWLALALPGSRLLTSVVFAINYVALTFLGLFSFSAASAVEAPAGLRLSSSVVVLIVFVLTFLLHLATYSASFREHLESREV